MPCKRPVKNGTPSEPIFPSPPPLLLPQLNRFKRLGVHPSGDGADVGAHGVPDCPAGQEAAGACVAGMHPPLPLGSDPAGHPPLAAPPEFGTQPPLPLGCILARHPPLVASKPGVGNVSPEGVFDTGIHPPLPLGLMAQSSVKLRRPRNALTSRKQSSPLTKQATAARSKPTR